MESPRDAQHDLGGRVGRLLGATDDREQLEAVLRLLKAIPPTQPKRKRQRPPRAI